MTCTSQGGVLKWGEGGQNTFLAPKYTHEKMKIQHGPQQMQEAMSYLVNWIWVRKVKCKCSGSQVVAQK